MAKYTEKSATHQSKELESEVLYQRLGDRVYAFTIMNNEVYFGAVPEAVILPTNEATIPTSTTESSAQEAQAANPKSTKSSRRSNLRRPVKDLEAA